MNTPWLDEPKGRKPQEWHEEKAREVERKLIRLIDTVTSTDGDRRRASILLVGPAEPDVVGLVARAMTVERARLAKLLDLNWYAAAQVIRERGAE